MDFGRVYSSLQCCKSSEKLLIMLFPKENWIKIRKQLLKQVKYQVQLRLGTGDAHSDYYLDYKKEFNGVWKESQLSELIRSIESSKIVLAGDFHAYSQSQRTHLRVLRNLNQNSNIVLALECIESKDQESLDKFVKNKITEKTFLRRVKWKDNWGFSWESYKPLFDLCRKRGYKIYGVNEFYKSRTEKTLRSRDAKAAARLVNICKENQGSVVYCIFGDLHLAKNHLPLRITQLDRHIKPTVVFQNSEKLYFRLAKSNLENKVDILRGANNRFCIIGSPPWVKWQSYLMYLEENYDLDISEGAESDIDYTDYVSSQIQFLAKDLGFEVDLNDLAVYSSSNQNFESKLSRVANREKERIIRYFIESDKSYYSPEDGYMYISRMTVNHAAELAGQYIQAKLSGQKKLLYKMPENFIKKIWIEGLCFYMSKLLNHKRKAESMLDLKVQLSKTNLNNKGKEALLLSLDQRLCEILLLQGHKGIKRKIRPKSKIVYLNLHVCWGKCWEREFILPTEKNESTLTTFKKC